MKNIFPTLAGNGLTEFAGDGGPATAASLGSPTDVAVGPDGSVYIADELHDRVRRVSPEGLITTLAGGGPGGTHVGDGGPATAASLSGPWGVAVGPDGSLYIAEAFRDRVRRVTPDGIITTVAGTGTRGFHGNGLPATSAQLNFPTGVAVGPNGSLYIADAFNDRIRRVGPDGLISTVVGHGLGGYNGDGIPARTASLSVPWGVAVGPDGSLYIADRFNDRVRRVSPEGLITTVAGSGLAGFNGDGGPATAAQLTNPLRVTVGPEGSLCIADTFNNRVRRVAANGIITTVAGAGLAGFSGAAGPALAARLDGPTGVAVGPDRQLYVADYFNERVRYVTPALSGSPIAETLMPSREGDEVYVFDPKGRHQRTVHAFTGTTLWTFAYTAEGFLSTLTDRDGDITIIERLADGTPTALVTPDGQQTALAVDTQGYLASVTNPAGEAYHLAYTPDGLMTQRTDPRGHSTLLAYDTLGRLVQDIDPAGGGWAIDHTDEGTSSTIAMTTGEERTLTFTVESLPTEERQHVNIHTDGTTVTTLFSTDETKTTVTANGTEIILRDGPDPRFGMLAPVLVEQRITTPGGLIQTVTSSRSAVLGGCVRPLESHQSD